MAEHGARFLYFAIVLVALCWAYRRNRFIAVGGIAVFFFFVLFALFNFPKTPEWVLSTVAFALGIAVIATIGLMVYYIVIFIGRLARNVAHPSSGSLQNAQEEANHGRKLG